MQRQNFTARIELKKKRRLSAGLMSERFPGVSGIVIHMTYYQNVSNPLLMVRTVNVFQSDYAYFNMDCMIKGCTDGGFDLTEIINNLIKNRKKTGAGKLTCKGKNEFLAPGHASIDYDIAITYIAAKTKDETPKKTVDNTAGGNGKKQPVGKKTTSIKAEIVKKVTPSKQSRKPVQPAKKVQSAKKR